MLAVTIAAIALAPGCRASDSDKTPVAEVSVPVLDRYTDVVEIDNFYEFEATTLDGDQIEGEDLQGQQLALWFWTPW